MRVTEIIDQIKRLKPDELRQVKEAVVKAEATVEVVEEAPVDEVTIRMRQALWDRLFALAEPSGGKHLSANIDKALYGTGGCFGTEPWRL